MGVALNHDAESRPDFLGPIYGGLRADTQVPSDAPTIFAAVASDDPVAEASTLKLYSVWKAAGVPIELHVFESGGHGWGMRKQDKTSDHWVDEFGWWLESRGLIKHGQQPASEALTGVTDRGISIGCNYNGARTRGLCAGDYPLVDDVNTYRSIYIQDTVIGRRSSETRALCCESLLTVSAALNGPEYDRQVFGPADSANPMDSRTISRSTVHRSISDVLGPSQVGGILARLSTNANKACYARASREISRLFWSMLVASRSSARASFHNALSIRAPSPFLGERSD
jgi:hypothetical protein